VFVEDSEVPVFDDDGTEYKDQAFEFSCRFHRTRRDKKIEPAVLEEDQRIRDAARAVKKGDICQMQYRRGDMFAGIVVENRKSEEMLLLNILPSGDYVEVEWKWLIVPDPSDYHLPKASANAIPLPPTRKAHEAINAKRSANESQIPRKGDTFVEGQLFTWAEFHTCHDIVNEDQVNLNLLDRPEQVWLYLPQGSTDTRPQYTHDPAVREHNSRSNFLDTVPKPVKTSTAASKRKYLNPGPGPITQGASPGSNPVSNPASSPASNVATTDEKPYIYKPRKAIHMPPIHRTSGRPGPPILGTTVTTPGATVPLVATQQQGQSLPQHPFASSK
jgi:hypothetical protein